jgi:hypothetical protein
MNRTNDKHFFELWDMAQKIRYSYEYARPKEKSEIIALEESLYDEGGFYADYTYQEAIQAYLEHMEEIGAI